MSIKTIVIIVIGCGILYWLLQIKNFLRIIKIMPLMEHVNYDDCHKWPKLSVIITARNEEDTIQEAVLSRLEDDYPDIEIIIVDDRSSDATGEIADNIASQDMRVKTIHVQKLPEGWLGKLYAMQEGVKQATGDWYLFSDADIHVKPTTMKRAIAYCKRQNMDHVAVLPMLWSSNFLLDTMLSLFMRNLAFAVHAGAVEDADSDAAVGVGAFNLIKRSAYEKTKGFHWLKLETADDMALGKMLKGTGARSSMLNGRGFIGLYFYRTLEQMAVGTERTIFTTLGNFSLLRLIVISIIYIALELSPFVAFIRVGIPYLEYIGVLMVVVALSCCVTVSRFGHMPVLPALLYPVGVVLTVGMWIRAGILGKVRRGIYWRGTFYSTKMLKQGKRYTF